jgi:glucosylceramidase
MSQRDCRDFPLFEEPLLPHHYSRRDFLAMSAATAAALSTSGAHALQPILSGEAPRGGIAVFITDKNRRFEAGTPLQWSASANSTETIAVDSSNKFQPLLGFGAALTDAACYNFSQLSSDARERLLRTLFHPSQMNLSVARICVGSSDYSRSAYSFDEGDPDPDLKRFSIEHDRAYILPVLRQARAINPDLFLLASPWSPPGWMKDNGSMLGGTIRRRYLGSYAQYLAKFLRGYDDEGVHVNALTSQNEVDTDQDSRMPACLFPQEAEVEFVGRHVGPALQKASLDTKIWLIDHNYNLWGRAIAELDDKDVASYTNAIAWHGYLGTPELIDRVHQAHPTAEMYWTEGGPDYTSPTYSTDWCSWSATFTGILRHWCRCIIAWNFALDEKGLPNIGPFPCGGLVTIDSQSKEVRPSGQYHAMTHFSRTFPRGAVRLDSQGEARDLHHVAARLSNGETAVVITNPGAARTIAVQSGSRRTAVELPLDSIVTLRWTES